jgi:hypothetical protein
LIGVSPLNDAPVLNTALNPALVKITEDPASLVSTPVKNLLIGVADPDGPGVARGMAVYGASSFNGTWQFSLNNGTTWQAMGAVTKTFVRLLPESGHVRFTPKADFNGTVQLYYRGWDQTQGSPGGNFDPTGNIGLTYAFSTATESASLAVTPVNDVPKLTFSGSLNYVHDTAAVTLAPFATVADIDSPDFSGGRLRVFITDGASSSNRLAIGSGFTLDANNNVLQGTTIIGKRVSNGFGTNELVITFKATATKAVVQQLVRAINFKTVGGAAGKRTINFTVSDGDGGLSSVAAKTVNVT